MVEVTVFLNGNSVTAGKIGDSKFGVFDSQFGLVDSILKLPGNFQSALIVCRHLLLGSL